jgi:hypothetical protein
MSRTAYVLNVVNGLWNERRAGGRRSERPSIRAHPRFL